LIEEHTAPLKRCPDTKPEFSAAYREFRVGVAAGGCRAALGLDGREGGRPYASGLGLLAWRNRADSC